MYQLKEAIIDAVDEGLIERDPTRNPIIKGKMPRTKKIKYGNQFELHTRIAHLDMKEGANWDWFILPVAKTGLRIKIAEHYHNRNVKICGLTYFFQRFIFLLNKTPCHVIVINTKGTTAHKVG